MRFIVGKVELRIETIPFGMGTEMYAGYVKWNDGRTVDFGFNPIINNDGSQCTLLNVNNDLLLIPDERILWKDNIVTQPSVWTIINGKKEHWDYSGNHSYVILTNKRILILRQPASEYPNHPMTTDLAGIDWINKKRYAASLGLKEFFLMPQDSLKWTIMLGTVFAEGGDKSQTYLCVLFSPKERTQILFAPFIPKNKISKKYLAEAKRFWKEIKHGGQVGED